ncbi:hypothetical protein DH2020_028628 [Rehmannia glutinosa]|uniref:Uncharacterized protein n=1 Tax=Rehmannia glutinosa TaxID=99300 RepID=A0ABR0VR32_REHGL
MLIGSDCGLNLMLGLGRFFAKRRNTDHAQSGGNIQEPDLLVRICEEPLFTRAQRFFKTPAKTSRSRTSCGYYTNDGEDLLRNRIAAQVSAKRKHGFCDDKVSSNEVFKLSLRAEADTWEKSRKNDAFDSISKSHSITDGRLNLPERKEQGLAFNTYIPQQAEPD